MQGANRTVLPVVGLCLMAAAAAPCLSAETVDELRGEPVEVLFGTYLCRVQAGQQVSTRADFASTGDLTPPPAAGAGDGITYYFPTLRVENTIPDPSASLESCESLAGQVERMISASGCTPGNRVGSSEGDLVGFSYVCDGPRTRVAGVIAAVGRAVLGARP